MNSHKTVHDVVDALENTHGQSSSCLAPSVCCSSSTPDVVYPSSDSDATISSLKLALCQTMGIQVEHERQW